MLHTDSCVGMSEGDMCHLPCYSNNSSSELWLRLRPLLQTRKKQLISVESIPAWLKEETPQKKRIYTPDLSGMLFHHRPINTSISSISVSSSNVFVPSGEKYLLMGFSLFFNIQIISDIHQSSLCGLPLLLYLNHALKTALLAQFFMLHAWALGRRVG